MKPELGSDKPVAVVVQGNSEPRVDNKNKVRRWIVIAVTVVISVALIITGFSLAFYFYSSTTSDMIKFYATSDTEDGGFLDEEIEGFVKTGSIIFKSHFTTEERDQYDIVYNHNQKLAVAAMLKASVPMCVVHHLDVNMTVEDLQEAIDGRQALHPYFYHVTTNGSVVTDASFLPPEARQMCADVTVVWGWTQLQGSDTFVGTRQKRGVCIGVGGPGWCYGLFFGKFRR
jgi:hypothetical protein